MTQLVAGGPRTTRAGEDRLEVPSAEDEPVSVVEAPEAEAANGPVLALPVVEEDAA